MTGNKNLYIISSDIGPKRTVIEIKDKVEGNEYGRLISV